MTGPGARILIVDDEPAIRRFLCASLTGHGYRVREAGTGAEALARFASEPPDLMILDIGLPDLLGVDVVRQVREWSRAPILMLSVRDSERDKVAALDAGADDYLTKPFGMEELLARVRAALRRSETAAEGQPLFTAEGLTVNLGARTVTLDGNDVGLTPREYDLLRLLVQHAGRVLTHRQLLSKVWGPENGDETHLLRVNVSNLRRKIERDPGRPRLLLTEAGVGYRLRGM